MSRWLILGIALIGVLVSPLVARAEEVKLGFIDMQRALNETEDGRKAKAKLKKELDQRQKELDEQQDQLKKDLEDFNKKRTLLPPETVQKKEAELQERLRKVQETYLRQQQDFAGKEQQETGKIVERMNRIIAKIASAENFTMVFERTQVVFAKQHLDLTNELIRRYNAGEGAAPAGASAPATGPAKSGTPTTGAGKGAAPAKK